MTRVLLLLIAVAMVASALGLVIQEVLWPHPDTPDWWPLLVFVSLPFAGALVLTVWPPRWWPW